MKKFIEIILYIIVFFVSVLVICEIWCRIVPVQPPSSFPKAFSARVLHAWLNQDNRDPLLPPYKLFANKDFNTERLKHIMDVASLTKNQTIRSYDFLRTKNIRDETYYEATINNLGFRDPPRAVQKPEGTFRIIALGSYHTFGHAVGDEDTYPYQLENILNNAGINDFKFEVWNGGRHASAAIVGLARVQLEIMNYQPDLLILDYGFIDPAILGDDTMPIVSLVSNKGGLRLISGFLQLTKKMIVGNSVFFDRCVLYFHKKYKQKNIEKFHNVFKKMLEITKAYNLPVIILRQSVGEIRNSYYQNISRQFDHVYYVDGEKAFEKYPPSHKLIQEFYSKSNWISEDGILDQENRRVVHYQEYYIDYYQYNKWGHKAIAEFLADKISTLFREKIY